MIRAMPTIGEFFRMIDEGDGVLTFFLTLAMVYLGNIASRVRHVCYRCGAYVAAVIAALYFIYAFITYGRMEPDSLIGILWRSLMAAGIAYGFAALTTALSIALIAPPTRTIRQWLDRQRRKVTDRFRDRRREQEQQVSRQLELEQQRQLAPLREEQRRNAEAAQTQRAQMEELRRKLRFQCQLTYNRFRPAVIHMFPQDEFRRLVEDALKATTVSDLEEAVQSLVDTLCAVLGGGKDDRDDDSLMAIAEDFDKRRAAVQNANYSPDRKDDLIKYLNLQEAKEITRALEK